MYRRLSGLRWTYLITEFPAGWTAYSTFPLQIRALSLAKDAQSMVLSTKSHADFPKPTVRMPPKRSYVSRVILHRRISVAMSAGGGSTAYDPSGPPGGGRARASRGSIYIALLAEGHRLSTPSSGFRFRESGFRRSGSTLRVKLGTLNHRPGTTHTRCYFEVTSNTMLLLIPFGLITEIRY